MQQDTKWERQLPLSWTAYCMLPYHKTHSKSNSVVLLPAMWCYTCHLKTVHVILQKWLHRIVHLFLSFLKKTTFSFFPLIGAEEGGGEKKHSENICTLPKPIELAGENELCDLTAVLTPELLPTVGLHKGKGMESVCLHIWLFASYLWVLHPGIHRTDI